MSCRPQCAAGLSARAVCSIRGALFVTPLAGGDELELERLLVELRRLARAGELPGGDVAEVLVVAERLAFGGLVLLAEVAAARLFAMERVDAHQLGELEEIRYAAGFLERLVELLTGARHRKVAIEFG